MSKIVTSFVYPPIPIRKFDWCAHDEGYDPGEPDGETGQYHGGSPIGWGRTEAEAIAEYREIIGEACIDCGREDYPRSCSKGGCPLGADL